jgi:hypothetical protein
LKINRSIREIALSFNKISIFFRKNSKFFSFIFSPLSGHSQIFPQNNQLIAIPQPILSPQNRSPFATHFKLDFLKIFQ